MRFSTGIEVQGCAGDVCRGAMAGKTAVQRYNGGTRAGTQVDRGGHVENELSRERWHRELRQGKEVHG